MIINTNEYNFTNSLTTSFQSKQYQYVYISIGSKFNQQDVYFKSASGLLANRVDTNAIMQMVPMFLRTKTDNTHILNIMIDTFSARTDLDMNERLIHSVIPDNMDCIIVNMKCTDTNLKEIFVNIMEWVLSKNISPLCFMICNYVKHMNEPNMAEYETEIMIPKCIQSVLHESNYNTCYYEWYGYKYDLYNCIYNVSFANRDLYFNQTSSHLISYVKLMSRPYISNATTPCSKLEGLLHNSYDISHGYDIDFEGIRIACPLKYTINM